MSWEIFSEWPSCGTELELEETFGETEDSRLFSTDHCITLDHATYVPSPATCKFSSHTNFTPTFNATPNKDTSNVAPTPVTAATSSCPHCKQTLAAGADVRAHVGPCFTAAQQARPAPKRAPSLKKHIDSIRHSATRMSASDRIGLLESLSRLAHFAKAGSEPSTGNRARPSDRLTLELLYSKSEEPARAPAPKRRKVDLTINVQNVHSLHKDPPAAAAPTAPFFHETFTPTNGPADAPAPCLDSALLFSPSALTDSTPPAHLSKQRPSSAKRNREIVQALSFSPLHYDAGPEISLLPAELLL